MKNINMIATLTKLGYSENIAKGQKTKLAKLVYGATLTEKEIKELVEIPFDKAVEMLTIIGNSKSEKKELAIKEIELIGGTFISTKKEKAEHKPKLTMKTLQSEIESLLKENKEIKEELVSIRKAMKTDNTKEDCQETK